ncbi:ArsR family transcriptional regulator [Vibrio cidicii]|uniref:ArsR family transcriptional regulator n=1 Tax=Vibrio cidicii TaxID=1763883 RepID=A0A151KQV7_9VIBR|nr:metalloregulator ArsR/SmtB family transcription factor [Vibrio cidicii]EJN6829424.1 helix-turn-helix transcriptional regulator [Vibrio cidicii]ELV8624917.1 helix-turn-helix transcriptional regulator [Vibrio cidicii]KYN79325.1 ArsR family transcriptional regulator [Vibrio cidicii]KYN83485.1 ArsR family transcriptional regulator [Vibrio cidicii]KYN86038.1 ArsR family transcriptional regulator [Vibrio cidicii]
MHREDSINLEQMRGSAHEVSELLKVMAHPERLMVLCQLTSGEVGVGQLQQSSTLSQSAFSQHLTLLRKHGLVKARKESQQVFYSLADVRVAQLISNLQYVFCHN